MRDKQRTGRDDGQRGDDNTFPHCPPPVSFLAPGPTSRYSGKRLGSPVVGASLAGSATTSSSGTARGTSCSKVKCVTGIGSGQLAPTDMHATEVRLCVAVSSVICGQRCILVESECVLGVAVASAAAAVRTLYLHCHLGLF